MIPSEKEVLKPCPHTKLEYIEDKIEPGWYCQLCGNYWEPTYRRASQPSAVGKEWKPDDVLAEAIRLLDEASKDKYGFDGNCCGVVSYCKWHEAYNALKLKIEKDVKE